MQSYVIIGSGVAGISACEAIRSLDPDGSILLIGDEAQGFYSRPGLAYYLTGELTEPQLFPFQEQDFRRLRLQRMHAQVARIHLLASQVELTTGERIPYDRLLVATGAMAARTNVSGSELEGVVKLDNLRDAQAILKLARKSRSAVVVGGGITALELVEGLIARRVKVHYLLRGDRYWSNVLDQTESRIVEHRLKEHGVRIHYHTEMDEILGKRGHVAGIRTKDGMQIPCEIVAVAIGIVPRKALAEAAGLKTDRGVLVDEFMQTSHPGVYAAGDVAQVYDPFTGKSVLDSLWGPAREQGSAAGLNMAGQPTPYYKLVPFNVTRLAALTTTIIGKIGSGTDRDLQGIARGDSETWRELPDAIAAQSNFEVNRLRILVGEQTLIGAIVMGDQKLSRALQHLVAEKVDISSIRQKLLEPGAPVADVIAEFWDAYKRKSVYAAS